MQLANRFCAASISAETRITRPPSCNAQIHFACKVSVNHPFRMQFILWPTSVTGASKAGMRCIFWTIEIFKKCTTMESIGPLSCTDWGGNDDSMPGLIVQYIDKHPDLYLAYMLLNASWKLRPFVRADKYLEVKII